MAVADQVSGNEGMTFSMSDMNKGGQDEESPDKNAEKAARDAKFDELMQKYNQGYQSDLMNENLSTDGYLNSISDRQKSEMADLKALKDNPEAYAQLSDNQKAELDARMQYLNYSEETRQIQEAYNQNPNDPEVAAKFKERQEDYKEYREAMQNDPAFNDKNFAGYDNIQELKKLEDKLENAKTESERKEIMSDINDQMRTFKQDLQRDEKGDERVLGFIERNKDNTVVQASGMAAAIEVFKARQAEMGQAQGQDLGKQEVTPAGASTPGGVQAQDGVAARVAENEVAGTTGMGGAVPQVQLNVRDTNDVAAPVAPGSTQPGAVQER